MKQITTSTKRYIIIIINLILIDVWLMCFVCMKHDVGSLKSLNDFLLCLCVRVMRDLHIVDSLGTAQILCACLFFYFCLFTYVFLNIGMNEQVQKKKHKEINRDKQAKKKQDRTENRTQDQWITVIINQPPSHAAPMFRIRFFYDEWCCFVFHVEISS